MLFQGLENPKNWFMDYVNEGCERSAEVFDFICKFLQSIYYLKLPKN